MVCSPKNGLHIQPWRKYLRAFHISRWGKIPLRYQSILDYARKHGLTLSDYSYGMEINETVIDRIEDYIVQIEISILGIDCK